MLFYFLISTFIFQFVASTTIIKTSKQTTTSLFYSLSVCEWNNITISCEIGTAIKVINGFFGRTSLDICPTGYNHSPIDCFFNATKVFANYFNGLQLATHELSYLWFGKQNDPCPWIGKYATIDYKCIKTTAEIKPLNTLTTCEFQNISISCPSGTTIKVRSGFFGRTSNDICPTGYINPIDCYLDALKVFSNYFNGLQSATHELSYLWFGKQNDPCPGTGKYSTIEYQCI